MPRVLALVSLCFLIACAHGAPGTSGSGGGPKLAMVTDTGGLGDRSFNDSAYAGLVRAKTQLGATIEVQESKSAADYQPNLTALADGDFDEIFAIGFLMNDDLAAVAKNYPDKHFAIIDAVNPQPNVTSSANRTVRFWPEPWPRWSAKRRRSDFWAASIARCCESSKPAIARAHARWIRTSRCS